MNFFVRLSAAGADDFARDHITAKTAIETISAGSLEKILRVSLAPIPVAYSRPKSVFFSLQLVWLHSYLLTAS